MLCCQICSSFFSTACFPSTFYNEIADIPICKHFSCSKSLLLFYCSINYEFIVSLENSIRAELHALQGKLRELSTLIMTENEKGGCSVDIMPIKYKMLGKLPSFFINSEFDMRWHTNVKARPHCTSLNDVLLSLMRGIFTFADMRTGLGQGYHLFFQPPKVYHKVPIKISSQKPRIRYPARWVFSLMRN